MELATLNELIPHIQSSDVKLGTLCSQLMQGGAESYEDALDEVERHMLKCERFGVNVGKVEMSWVHSDGVTAKKMFSPAGLLVIGKKHTHNHITIMSSGKVLMFTGGGTFMAEAPCDFISEIGSRKLGIVTEDMTVYNVLPNPNNIRDEDELSKMFTEDDDVLLEHRELKKQEPTAQEHYDLLCDVWGITDEDALALMELMPPTEADVDVDESFDIRDSEIQGVGLFATKDIQKGEEFPMVYKSNRTAFARYSNHSFNPNMTTKKVETNVVVVASCDIKKGEEVTTNYMDNANISIQAAKELLCLQQ